MTIPSIPLENLVNKVLKILSEESSPLVLSGLKNQLQPGKLFQGEIVKILPNNKATISIAGQKVVAELPDIDSPPRETSRAKTTEFTFKPGQKINVQVEKVNPEPVLKLVPAPEQRIQEEGYTTNLSRKIKPEIIKHDNFSQLKLPPDKIVPVKIDRIVNANTLLVQFEDQEIHLKTENANLFRPGEKVRIQFQKVENGFKPVLLENPEAKEKINLDLIKPYLPSRRPLMKLVGELNRDVLASPALKELAIKPELIGRLKETLQALTPKAGNIPNKVKIEEQVDKSGVRYEAKVKQLLSEPDSQRIKSELTRDLKGQLLDLKQATEKAIKNVPELNQNRQVTEFQQRINVSLDSIELNQLSSRVSTQENQPLVLQIPNPLNPDEKTISLFIRGEPEDGSEGGKAEKEIYNLAFFLELSELGNVKINAKVGPESLAVRMDVEKDDIAEYIRGNTEEFESRMKDNDMSATVECCVEEKVSPIKDNLIELLVSQNTSLLSVKT